MYSNVHMFYKKGRITTQFIGKRLWFSKMIVSITARFDSKKQLQLENGSNRFHADITRHLVETRQNIHNSSTFQFYLKELLQ